MPVTFSARGPIALPSAIVPATTWNPLDRDASVTLSPDNLTASASSSVLWVRSVKPILAGQKVYFECLVNSLGSPATQGFYIGFLRSSVSLVGGFDFNFRIFGSSQGNYNSPTSADDGQLFTTSTNAAFDVIRIAYDDTAKKIWAALGSGIWNNNGSADPATGVGGFVVSLSGTIHAAWSADPAGGTASGTARFASASWGFIAPVGYSQINA